HLILIGLPGSGKTTAGRALANALQLPFSDCDEAVEQAAHMTVPEIFRREGEPGFRARETAALQALTALPARIIACGGGVVTVPANRPLLRSGVVIFWDRSPGDIMSTCQLADRPLLQSTTLARLWEQRLPLYQAWADAVVDARDFDAAVARAAALWREKTCDF
ncbi:MAG: shikimate kinase, partial [Oscillospiraceae bacterium]|nr:shikimate kinase [Oscillospiraceae bacterium]